MVKLSVSPADAGQSLEGYLRKRMPDAPLSAIHRLLRTKQVRLNDKRTNDPRLKLAGGDEIVVFTDTVRESREKQPPFTKRPITFKVVFEDQATLVVDKPAGLPVHDERGADNLDEQVLSYLIDKGEYAPEAGVNFKPGHAHRIDAPTRGLVVYAKTRKRLAELGEAFADHERVKKYYKAKLEGKLPANVEVVGFITKDPTHVNRMVFSDKQTAVAQTAVTRIKVVAYDEKTDTTDVEMRLMTGRKHQLRATASYLGHPVVGDERYGAKAGGELQLVSWRTVIDGQEFKV